jgi:hypothetical protein
MAKQQQQQQQQPQTPVTTNGLAAKSTPISLKQNVSTEVMPNDVELRNLESWHDESAGQLDDSFYQELVDSDNTNGWNADEMFKYNEKRHKVLSSYSEKTLSGEYTTPISKNKSKTTLRLATKLAKEIEDKVNAEGRVTPESSDDDEMFERERTKRLQLKQTKHLDQLRNLKIVSNGINHSQNRHSTNGNTTTTNNTTNMINKFFASTNTGNYQAVNSARKSNRSSSQHSNSSATPATASISSSPTLNDSNMIMKPVASSSRNILRTCLI